MKYFRPCQPSSLSYQQWGQYYLSNNKNNMEKHTNLTEEIYHATEESHWTDYAILIGVAVAVAIIAVEFIFGDAITSWMLHG